MSTVALKPFLIAEDSDDDAFVLCRLLAECGLKNPVNIVPDGKQAIAYLNGDSVYSDRTRYDVPAIFLLDWYMRRTSGLEVLDWMKTQPKPAFPTVVITGLANLNEMREALLRGADSFLIKPLTRADLLDFVGRFKGIEMSSQNP